MANVNFIELYTNKLDALSVRTSPIIDQNLAEYRGVQLLPNNELPYVQTTLTSEETNIDDWVAYVVELCNETNETDITAYFHVEQAFNDTNGVAQLDWSLTNVPFDFGYKLIYLRVEQAFGETFYSTPFMITAHESEKTCRIDYRNRSIDTMQSTQLPMYFWQNLKQTELNSYYEVTTRNTKTSLVKSQKYERWITKFVIENDLMIKIDDAFENKFVYIDLIRCNLFEANEIKEFEATENFSQNILKLAFNRGDVYDPLYVEPVTPVLTPTITLNSVITNGINALYNFTLANFNPSFLTFQTSQNQVNWNSANGAITSPFSLLFNDTGVWYFRIITAEAISNVIELDLTQDVEANNDIITVGVGEIIEISPLFNDVLVGETLITSVTTPSEGTAEIIEGGTKIRYTHTGLSSGIDAFQYTIGNGISTDTATVKVGIEEMGLPFNISFFGDNEGTQLMCGVSPEDEKYLDAYTEGYPALFDIVYDNSTRTQLFNGGDLWYSVDGGRLIRVNNQGEIYDVYFC